ncbi:hypothetical protein I6E17_06150 [Fusobacterium perfoetens]|uniref:hypothetical protein n=1 Tax=Fusobacterium perfoetens TaxID=852 RepID=UPI0015A16321|nr:hypothetical protein [Fusobacterium perfoetens]MCF2625760.1 hypothetical protein [Fusobacterium perfoetens]
MREKEEKSLLEELKEFEKEKDRIRQIVGKIGGKNNTQVKRVNSLLIGMIIALLFMGGVLRKMSLELTMYLAILLGITKIIWMLYETKKSNHFQFWILNSIEVRINEMAGKINKIEKKLREAEEAEKQKDADENK